MQSNIRCLPLSTCIVTSRCLRIQCEGAEVFLAVKVMPKALIIIILGGEHVVEWQLASVEVDIYHPPLPFDMIFTF